VGVQEVRWDKGGTERAEDYTFFYGAGNEDHQTTATLYYITITVSVSNNCHTFKVNKNI
jgi:ribosomal protein L31